MNESPAQRDHEWLDYYRQFAYFSPATVRDGCHPRIMEHDESPAKAIVLVHGLTDSPYFLTAIGEYFYNHLGYNVYLPLLHCHGLKDPQGMEGVDLDEWKANVNFAVAAAKAKANQISIGGLSTGGTLSFYTAVQNPNLTGALFLFSAALDLAGGIRGDLRERILRIFPVDILDTHKPMIGPNPYRYARMDMDGARELSKLIEQTDALLRRFSAKEPFAKPVFAAHSESDSTANIAGIEELQGKSLRDRFTFYRIPRKLHVAHASVVLRDRIEAGEASEEANPKFHDMMDALAAVA